MKGGADVTFIDFFAGVGGFTKGLVQAGMTCRGYCENDKFALKSYRAIHSPSEEEWFSEDIRTAKGAEIPYVDGWTAGFPCQNLSNAGDRSGLHGERSGLFFEVIRLLKEKR
jgi:DNA (cytosine-5)-methyltransferase 1